MKRKLSQAEIRMIKQYLRTRKVTKIATKILPSETVAIKSEEYSGTML